MNHIINIFQDDDDVRNGMVQFCISDDCGKSVYIYFTLDEWQTAKEATNKFKYSLKKEDICRPFDSDAHISLDDNPLSCIDQDGTAVQIQFGGMLGIDLYYENPNESPENKLWEIFKKAVNQFIPEILGDSK